MSENSLKSDGHSTVICDLLIKNFITTLLFFLAVTVFAQNPVKAPSLKWKFTIKQPFIASPVIESNVVYTGGLDSTLYALDQNNGQVKWKFKTVGSIRSAVKIVNQKVFLNGGDGSVYCLDKSSGKKLWVFNTPGSILGERRYDPADYFNAEPLVNNNSVYIGSGDGRLYAIKENDGTLQWSFKADDIIHTNPVLYQDKLMFGSSDGHLYAVHVSTGQLLWKFKSVGHRNFPKGEMQGSPVISGNLVFIGSRDYNLYAVDIMGGYCHWNKQFPFGWATALTATDSVLYTGTSDDKLFLAMDPRTGRELWKLDARFNIFGPPMVLKSNVYFATQMGKVFEVNRRTGVVNWIYTTEGYNKHRLNFFKEDDTFRDDIYTRIKSFDDYIRMLYTIGAIYSTPAVTDEAVVFTSTEGIVYCLKRN